MVFINRIFRASLLQGICNYIYIKDIHRFLSIEIKAKANDDKILAKKLKKVVDIILRL